MNNSDLYQRSCMGKYKQYFAQNSDITKAYAKYSIDRMKCEPPLYGRSWEEGRAGVPILWERSANVVYNDHTDTHTLVIGPPGSKKSRLVAMPLVRILGVEKENMIITDPKAEIYNRTASFLASQGYRIHILNLRTPDLGDAWNPLTIPYQYYCEGDIDRAYEFVNDISENLMNSEENHSDPFWHNSAASFFFGLTILLFKYCKEKQLPENRVTIQNVIALRYKLLSQPSKEARERPSVIWRYAKTDPIISNNLVGTIETAEDTRGGIVSTFDQKMRMFSIQPNLMEMLSNNTFQLDHLDDVPTAIFLILPDEKTGYHGIGSLFIKQSYEYLIYLAQKQTIKIGSSASLRRRMNYIIDEFASLPTIPDFSALITAARSRNIRFTLIAQSKHQLIQRYKDETDTIMTNCTNWLILTSREQSFLEELSALCGKTLESPFTPIVPADSIQRLSKDNGEALLLSGRRRPFITHLPDIEKYDQGHYSYRPLAKRKQEQFQQLTFFEEEEKLEKDKQLAEEKQRREFFERLISSQDTDKE